MTNVVYHLNMKRLFLIVFLFSSLNLLFSQGFQKGFIALKSKNYQIAEITFRSCEKKHAAAAAFGLASLYLTNDYYNKDSSFRYVLLAENKWNLFDEKNREKARVYGFDSSAIQQLKLKVSSLFYADCSSSILASDFQKFMDNHPWSSYCLTALVKRDSLLFENVKIARTSKVVSDFILAYPKSYLIPSAIDLFDDLQYSEATVSGRISDYVLFIETYPNNKNRKNAEDQIYKLSIQDKSFSSYLNFIKNYPQNTNHELAWKGLYANYTKDCKLEYFKEFQREFPDFPFQELIQKDLDIYSEIYFPFFENNLFGFMDSKGIVQIPAEYDEVLNFQDGIAVVVKNGKSGLINKKNELILGFEFDQIEEFYNDLAIVVLSDSFGLINRMGTVVFPLIYKDILFLNKSLIAANNEKGYSIFNLNGERKIELNFKEIKPLKEDYFIVQIGDSIGLLNSNLGFVIPAIYEDITLIKDSIFSYQLDEKKGLITHSGRILTLPVYNEFSSFDEHSQIIIARYGSKMDYLNLDGSKFISSTFEYFPKALKIAHFYNGNAIFYKNGKFGIINSKGKILLKPTFTALGKVSNAVPVTKNGIWGFMDITGKIILDYNFISINEFYDLGFIVEFDGLLGLLGNDLKPVLSVNHQSIKRIGENYLVAKKDGKYGVYSVAGEQVVPFNFDLIQLHDSDCLALTNENGIAYYFLSTGIYILKQ